MPGTRRSRSHRGGLTLALVAVAAAAVLGVVVLRAQVSAPQPHASGRIDPAPTLSVPDGEPSSGTGEAAAPLGPSRPVSVSIPAIGVHSVVNPIGLAADGTLAVPQPGPHLDEAAWFRNSPTPGQPGPAVIEGHVDSAEGPSVFFRLGDVTPGDRVVVRRADGRLLTFRVDAVRDFLKSRFPTTVVYGSRDLGQPTLRLITCSDFDASIRHHVGNEVVFAHLVHATAPTGGAATATASATIHITGFAFRGPSAVRAGSTVTVTNSDSEAHSVTADDGAFDVTVPPGATRTFTAPTTPGSHPYHCTFHSDMHATLQVR